MDKSTLHPVEHIKKASNGLRGTLPKSLENDITGALYDDDQTLIKFHGMYQQDDRDLREERVIQKLEPLFSYMIRLRIPGGKITAAQWIAADEVSGNFGTGIIKITTRQTIQLHGIMKRELRPMIQDLYRARLDSIAACGDINRNVMCSAHPMESAIHEQVHRFADLISSELLPKSRAWYEVWVGSEKISEVAEEDPLYGETYLPRKFKIAIAIPPNNDVDVFANDIGLIAIIENGKLSGFNVVAGGGLSTTHGNASTYPRLGTVLGFVQGETNVLKVVYEIMTIQRDFGNRSDRKQARLKYTIDRMGIEVFKEELAKRTGFNLEEYRPFLFNNRTDHYGWHTDHHWNWHFTLFVENGLIQNTSQLQMKSALREIAQTGKCDFLFSGNQNLIISNIAGEHRSTIDAILKKYELILHNEKTSPIRKNAIACVAFNTCPLALAEAQRYMPTMISHIEKLLVKYELKDQEIISRMSGCPNGCSRPYLSEIGFVGTEYGKYNLMLGGDRQGQRLNKLFKSNLNESQLLQELDTLLAAFREGRKQNEFFGDFVERTVFSDKTI